MSIRFKFPLHRWVSIGCVAAAIVGCATGKRPVAEPQPVVLPITESSRFTLASHRGEHASDDTKQVSDREELPLVEELDEQLSRAAAEPDRDASSSPGLSPRIRPFDAGAAPSSFRDMNESEMLALAVAHSPVLRSLGLSIVDNPAATTTVYDAAITANDPFFGPQAALAEFDSVLSASVNSQNNDRVFNNAIEGGGAQELVQDLVSMNAGWQRRTQTGAIWEINHLNGYDANNRDGNAFPNYWESQLEAGVRKPMLQGAGRDFNLIAGPNARPGFNFSKGLLLARLNTQISQADFELRLQNFVRDLFSAYWDLDRQFRDYQNVIQAQEIAYKTWQTVRAKGEAHLAGGEANKEAQARAKYYEYRRQALVALGGQGGQGGLYVAERRLRNLIGLPIVDGQLIRPSDDPVEVRFVYDFDRLVSEAMAQRTELRRQSMRVREHELRLIAAKNFLLPQLDLIGRYRLRGLGDDWFGSGPRFSSAYQDFFSFDHQEWEFGMEMGVVHGRRQAHAAVRHAKLQLNRERTILAEQQREVEHELSDAYAEVGSSWESMQASQAQVDASRERLESSEALYEADKIQIEFLLDAQEELLRAELQLATDMARYTMALISVSDVSGSLLRDLGVFVNDDCCQSHLLYVPAEEIARPEPTGSVPTEAAAPTEEKLPAGNADKAADVAI